MKPMYYGIPFSPQATLTDTIGAADTIIKVSDVSAFPDAPNYATIGTDEGGETILYTAKTANALSGCTRGVEGSAKSWNAGELIGRNYTAADHAAMIDNIKDAAKTAEADGVTLPVSGWSNGAQTVQNAGLVVSGYGYIITPDPDSYGAYTSAVIYADSVTTEGQITFHCEETPTEALKVSIMKIKVEG